MSIAVRVESFRELNSFSRSSPLARVCVCVFTRCVHFLFLFLFLLLSLFLSLLPTFFYHFLQISRNTRKNRVGGERIVV